MKIISKQPNEIIPLSMVYGTGSYPVGATLSSATVSCVSMSDGSDTTSAIVSSPTCTALTLEAKCTLKAQSVSYNRTKHKLTFLATFSDGTKLEDDVQIVVSDI